MNSVLEDFSSYSTAQREEGSFLGATTRGINVRTPAKPRILAVDDEPRLLNSLVELVGAHGYEVRGACGGAEAIQLLGNESFDVVLLDLMMPNIDGRRVMEFISERDMDASVVVVSGDASLNAAIDVLRCGAYDFLRKPYAPEILLRTIENAWKKRNLERENQSMQARILESEKLHRYLVNSSPDLIYILDAEGRITFLNDRIEEILGFRKDELIGKHFSILLYPEDLPLVRHAINERRTGERASRNVEMRFRCKATPDTPRYFNANEISVELSAMGMYRSAEAGARPHFTGTYGVARDITERKKAELIINYQAYHDLLTGLPNRALFRDRLGLAIAQARRSKHMLAVMFIDLDRFKMVNDTLGHVAGDELLQAVSTRFKGCLREGDTLARVGGDEFMLLLSNLTSRADAEMIARKLVNSLQEPFHIDTHELFVNVSIGIALHPEHGKTIDNLIKHADIAMYQVKGHHKNGYGFYADDMHESISRHLSLESGLRKALEQDQFRVYYQPQVNVQTGGIIGFEALIRWEHPSRGLLQPAEFIGLAEETGLITPIGDALMHSVFKQIRSWDAAGLPPVRMGINLSSLQIEQYGFVDTIRTALTHYGLPGERLEIEITENVIMRDMENVIQTLRELSSYGITIAIDDFGTGYSSLSYLRKLPIHTLKIDRSFVNDIRGNLDETSIIRAIVAMGHGLGLNLIAEGVETQQQVRRLHDLGCHSMQGYIFCKPVKAEMAQRLLGSARPYHEWALGKPVRMSRGPVAEGPSIDID